MFSINKYTLVAVSAIQSLSFEELLDLLILDTARLFQPIKGFEYLERSP
jgi:hypothetical protein